MIELSQEIRVLNTTAELIESSVNHMVYSFYKNEIDIDIVTEVKPKDLIRFRNPRPLGLRLVEPTPRRAWSELIGYAWTNCSECWSTGVLEYWAWARRALCFGEKKTCNPEVFAFGFFPLLHYSNTPENG